MTKHGGRVGWRWLLPTLCVSLLSLSSADSVNISRHQNLALVEDFCVRSQIHDDSRSLDERNVVAIRINDRLSADAELYDLPIVRFCVSDEASAMIFFTAAVLGNGLRYDLLVLSYELESEGLSEPTIYSLGGIVTITGQDWSHVESAELLLEKASELFRDFALDWKDAN